MKRMMRLLVAGLLCLCFQGGLDSQEIPLADDPVTVGRTNARSDHTPYDGDWWPATNRNMVDALRGVSDFLGATIGFNPRLHEIEMFRHYVGPGSPIRPKYENRGISDFNWWGHCNGWAAAACLERNPPQTLSRTVNGKTYSLTNTELQGFLAEAYYHADALMSGMRSFLSTKQFQEAKKLIKNNGSEADWKSWYKNTFREDAPASYRASDIRSIADRGIARFEDINPATFDRAVRTVIGKAKIPLVIEIYAGDQVWNYAGYDFQREVKDTGRTTPQGQRIVDVEMKLETLAGTKNYTYELYLDSNGRSRSGAWTGQSVTEHPDFIWSPLDPRFRLNEIMAEAFAKNIMLDFDDAELERIARSRDQAGLQKLRASINEVAQKIAPQEVMDAATMSNRIYRRTLRLVNEWNNNPWRSGGGLQNHIERGLARSLGYGTKFRVNLYNEVAKALPADHRAVTNVADRLNAAAGRPQPQGLALMAALGSRGDAGRVAGRPAGPVTVMVDYGPGSGRAPEVRRVPYERGMTALGALESAGLDVELTTVDPRHRGAVDAVEGARTSLAENRFWQYEVNGRHPESRMAHEYQLRPGSVVRWQYGVPSQVAPGHVRPQPGVAEKAAAQAKRFAGNFGIFGGGFLIAEGLSTVEESIRARRPVLDRWTQMANLPFALDFTKNFAIFSGAAAATHAAVRGLAAAAKAVPALGPIASVLRRAPMVNGLGLAAGIAAIEWIATGKPPDPARLAVTTGSFILTNAVTRRVLTLALGQVAKRAFLGAAGPVGWGILALDLGLTLYFGRGLESLIWDGIQALAHRRNPDRDQDATHATTASEDARTALPATSIVEQLDRVAGSIAGAH